MKKTLTLLILLFTTLFSANAEEITVWESAEGLAGNLRLTTGSAELNTILDNIQVGDIFSIYYKGATRNVNASTLTVGVVNYLYVQNQDWNNYSSDVVGSYNDNLRYENGYQEIIVTQAFIDAITSNGLALQRGVHSGYTNTAKIMKITLSRPDTKVPGYEILFNEPEPNPIAWGKDTYLVPKKRLVNLTNGDIVHGDWDVNTIWDAHTPELWYPTVFRLVTEYNGQTAINNHNTSISKSNPNWYKEFTLDATSISTIQANDLVFSGYYYNLTYAYLKHPGRFVDVTMSSEGLATFSHATEAIDLTPVVNELSTLKGYVATISGDKVVTTPVTKVPAGTGIILKGTPNATYSIPFAASADAIAGNVLEPTNGSAITGYVLGKVGGNVGFYRVTNKKEVVAGKAYIPATFGSARAFSIDFLGNDVTGIEETLQSTATPQAATYNLMGQRVAANQKGLVIVNGKKYINK